MRDLESLEQLLALVLSETGLSDLVGGSEVLISGLRELQAELLRIGLDVQVARARVVPLAQAVRDFHNYPALARAHTALDDGLRWSMPPGVAAWARQQLLQPSPPILEELRGHLVERAASAANPILRLLCEWALFEWVYLTLTITAHLQPECTFMLGMDNEDLAEIAEQTVARWLAASPALSEGIRPFHVLAAAAMDSLTRYADVLQKAMADASEEYRDAVTRRARLDLLLAELDAADAVLIRNDLATKLGERPLSAELLQEQRPFLFPGRNRNAIDQRKSRTRKKLLTGGIAAARRKKPAMVDLIRELVELAATEPKSRTKSKTQRSPC